MGSISSCCVNDKDRLDTFYKRSSQSCINNNSTLPMTAKSMDESINNGGYTMSPSLMNSTFQKDDDAIDNSLFIKLNDFTIGKGKVHFPTYVFNMIFNVILIKIDNICYYLNLKFQTYLIGIKVWIRTK